jgi:hypothetical protein
MVKVIEMTYPGTRSSTANPCSSFCWDEKYSIMKLERRPRRANGRSPPARWDHCWRASAAHRAGGLKTGSRRSESIPVGTICIPRCARHLRFHLQQVAGHQDFVTQHLVWLRGCNGAARVRLAGLHAATGPRRWWTSTRPCTRRANRNDPGFAGAGGLLRGSSSR